MQVLTFEEISMVSGGDRDDATVAGGIAGGTAGWHAFARGGALGMRLGVAAGPVGMAGGIILGAGAAFLIYKISA
ncbi:hypothetical protein [Massilia sp. ST3]|uniref:hypothetical protein n=1 Tax=Massilia sp. ST3 TaxID=2824903 RepID=UPI001B81856C|nr:hypothetical protein [Massilia sp. ST3]MBQ5947815.1 hypothetical protein [Massilia sp. ST3]